MRIIKPKPLKLGSTVGIVSPSEPVTPGLRAQFDAGVSALKEFGLKVKIGKHVFDQHFYSAGTREDRITDFNQMWADPEVEMILMSQGGETANHLLNGIDYEMIQANPKIFAGISDGTTLLNAIFAKTGLVTYHGPELIWLLGRGMSKPFKDNFKATFFDGDVGNLYENKNWRHLEQPHLKCEGWCCVRGGVASGVLVGGHSGCLINTTFAGYGPDFKDKILFLEGTDQVGYLDRQFTSLKLRGVFDEIRGLVIGWFEGSGNADKQKNRPVRDLILEVTDGYNFPVLEISELGHNIENYVLPIGCSVTIDAEKKSFSIDERTVE